MEPKLPAIWASTGLLVSLVEGVSDVGNAGYFHVWYVMQGVPWLRGTKPSITLRIHNHGAKNQGQYKCEREARCQLATRVASEEGQTLIRKERGIRAGTGPLNLTEVGRASARETEAEWTGPRGKGPQRNGSRWGGPGSRGRTSVGRGRCSWAMCVERGVVLASGRGRKRMSPEGPKSSLSGSVSWRGEGGPKDKYKTIQKKLVEQGMRYTRQESWGGQASDRSRQLSPIGGSIYLSLFCPSRTWARWWGRRFGLSRDVKLMNALLLAQFLRLYVIIFDAV